MKPPSFWEPTGTLFNMPAFLLAPDQLSGFWQMQDDRSKPAYWNQEGELSKKEGSFLSMKEEVAFWLASGQKTFAGFLKTAEAGERAQNVMST